MWEKLFYGLSYLFVSKYYQNTMAILERIEFRFITPPLPFHLTLLTFLFFFLTFFCFLKQQEVKHNQQTI